MNAESLRNGAIISEVSPSGYGKPNEEAPEFIKTKLTELNDPKVWIAQTKDPAGKNGTLIYFRTDVVHDLETLLNFKFSTQDKPDRYKVIKYPESAISGKATRYHRVLIEDKGNPVVKNLRPVIESLFATLRRVKNKTHKATFMSF